MLQPFLESDNRHHSHTPLKESNRPFKSSPPLVPHTKLLDKSMVRVKPPENKLQESMWLT